MVRFLAAFFISSLTPLYALEMGPWMSTIAEFESVYKPLAQDQGKALDVKVEEGEIPSASAHFDGQRYVIKITTGFLEQPKLDKNTLLITLCHEAGHLFGGNPRKHVPPEWDGPVAEDGLSYMSSEGQADYYATRICFPKVGEVQALSNVPPIVSHSCEQAWSDAIGISLCEQSSVASKNFLRLAYEFNISFETPDLTETPTLIQDYYPGRQCRLDTLFRGALKQDRPRCWFK